MRSRSEGALSAIIGKIVTGIVLTQNEQGNPRSQVFLTFSDGASYEFWSDEEIICTASGLDHHCLGEIVAIQTKRKGTSVRVFRAPHEDLDQPQRNLLVEE